MLSPVPFVLDFFPVFSVAFSISHILFLNLVSWISMAFLPNCSTPASVPSNPPKLVVSLIIAWISTLSPLSGVSSLL